MSCPGCRSLEAYAKVYYFIVLTALRNNFAIFPPARHLIADARFQCVAFRCGTEGAKLKSLRWEKARPPMEIHKHTVFGKEERAFQMPPSAPTGSKKWDFFFCRIILSREFYRRNKCDAASVRLAVAMIGLFRLRNHYIVPLQTKHFQQMNERGVHDVCKWEAE